MNEKQQYGVIAEALREWLRQWGDGVSEKQMMDDLRDNWQAALDLLKNLLTGIDIHPIPGDLDARNHNKAEYPQVNPILLIELLTPIHDLETFGPTTNFLPWKPIETIAAVHNAFERNSH